MRVGVEVGRAIVLGDDTDVIDAVLVWSPCHSQFFNVERREGLVRDVTQAISGKELVLEP